MLIIIKIVIWLIFLYYVFKAFVVDLCVAFYKPATDTVVDSIQEQGLAHYVQYSAIEDFFRHIFIVFIFGSMVYASINISQTTDDNGKEIKTITIENNEKST